MNNKLKPTIRFPDPHLAGEDGLLAIGGELTVGNLYEAYRQGVFPWPQEDLPMLWFCPDERGVVDFDELHIPKSLAKLKRQEPFSFSINQAFDLVIELCARQVRKDQDGTWILPKLKKAYIDFHRNGYAHSVECWSQGELVGGIYGVFVEGVFSGESMFFRRSGASKLSLLYLIEHLKKLGLSWMDTQMVTPALEQFGAKYISRAEFLNRIETSHRLLSHIRFEGE